MRSGPLRSKPNSEVTWCQPSPTSPSTSASVSEDLVEEHLVEVVLAVHQHDGIERNPGQSGRHDELAEAGVPVVGIEGLVRASTTIWCARCAPLVHTLVPLSSQPPSVRVALVLTAARSEPAPCSLMPIAGVQPARGDPRQQAPALLLGAVRQQPGGDLPVGDPVRPDGRAVGEQFLGHDVAVQVARPAPPYSVGMVIPTKPASASRVLKAASHWPTRSRRRAPSRTRRDRRRGTPGPPTEGRPDRRRWHTTRRIRSLAMTVVRWQRSRNRHVPAAAGRPYSIIEWMMKARQR